MHLEKGFYPILSVDSADLPFWMQTKGQLISKCPFGVIVWTKIPTKKFPRFLP